MLRSLFFIDLLQARTVATCPRLRNESLAVDNLPRRLYNRAIKLLQSKNTQKGKEMNLDKIDNKILQLLLQNGRTSFTDIAEQVGLSRTAVKNRVQAMQQSGVIAGYTVVLNNSACGAISFLVEVEMDAESYNACMQQLCNSPLVSNVIQTTSKTKLFAICQAPDVNTMKGLLQQICNVVDNVKAVRASTVTGVVKRPIIDKV